MATKEQSIDFEPFEWHVYSVILTALSQLNSRSQIIADSYILGNVYIHIWKVIYGWKLKIKKVGGHTHQFKKQV